VEWVAGIVMLAIIFGPIVWALTAGRKGGTPENDDAAGATAYGSFIRRVLTGGRKS